MIYHKMVAAGMIKPGRIGLSFDMHVAKPASNSAADIAATNLYNETFCDWLVFPFTRGYYPPGVVQRLNAMGFQFGDSPEQMQQDLALRSVPHLQR